MRDESAAKTSDDLFAFLGSLGIAVTTKDHAPVFTVAEAQAVRDAMPGGHTKNLFLKDKKEQYFLLCVGEETDIDLKRVHTQIGAKGRVSFGKSEALMELLGVIPGAVTPFAIINDTDRAVTLILDADLMDHETINVHPLRNDATTAIARDDLVRFVEATGHVPTILKLSADAAT